MGKIKAVIFDLDGLMLNTEELNGIVFRDVMNKLGHKIPNAVEWYYNNIIGKRADKIFPKIREDFGIEAPHVLIERFREYRAEFFKTNPPQAKKGLIELLNFLKMQGIKTAICSSARLDQIKLKMEKAGVSLDYFDTIIDGSLVKESKPHPESYQTTCEKLNVKPENALALEDSDHGIQSAHGAGIRVILVPDVKIIPSDIKPLAWHIVKSLDLVIPIIKEAL